MRNNRSVKITYVSQDGPEYLPHQAVPLVCRAVS
jgi:hypothetical protein